MPVDREVDGTPESRVIRKERSRRIQDEAEALVAGRHKELRLIDPVLGRKRSGSGRTDDAIVGCAALDLERDRIARNLKHPVDLSSTMRAIAPVVRVDLEDDLTRCVTRDVVRPGHRRHLVGLSRQAGRDRAEKC